MNREVTYTIETAYHWEKLKPKEELVDISQNSYFGIRAMEKKALAIIYDPTLIDNLIKLCSEAKKYPNTKHVLILDASTLGFDTKISEKIFLEASKKIIDGILNVNGNIKLGFEPIGFDVAFNIISELERMYIKNI